MSMGSLARLAVLAVLLIAPCLACAQTTAAASLATPASGGENWKPLFNGKDLTGWYTFLKDRGRNSDPDKLIQVVDGTVHLYKDAAEGSRQPFGYICTDEEFGDCRIRFEYKWGTKKFAPRAKAVRDSGILYFVFGPDDPNGRVWPHSVECQVQENDVGDIYAIGTGVSTTIDPASKSAKQPTFMEASAGGVPWTGPRVGYDRIIRSEMLEKDGWNTVEVILEGDRATHVVNGKVNMRVHGANRPDPSDPNQRVPLTRGRIVLQAEGAEVMFRNIEVAPLSAEAKPTTAPASTRPAAP